jgi:hypothetical protein
MRRFGGAPGFDATLNTTPLLATPPTVTTTTPVVAPTGTGTTMLVAAHVVGVAAVPLNVTVLVPCLVPKFAPAMVTGVPTGPEVCERPVTMGAWETTVTVHVNVLLLVSESSDTVAVTV